MVQCLAEARTTFPAATHYAQAAVHAHTDAMAPPECKTRPQQLRLPECVFGIGDFVAVRVPGNLEKAAYKAGVTEWESDGVTPHVMVARVDEIFEDATVRAAFCCFQHVPCCAVTSCKHCTCCVHVSHVTNHHNQKPSMLPASACRIAASAASLAW